MTPTELIEILRHDEAGATGDEAAYHREMRACVEELVSERSRTEEVLAKALAEEVVRRGMAKLSEKLAAAEQVERRRAADIVLKAIDPNCGCKTFCESYGCTTLKEIAVEILSAGRSTDCPLAGHSGTTDSCKECDSAWTANIVCPSCKNATPRGCNYCNSGGL